MRILTDEEAVTMYEALKDIEEECNAHHVLYGKYPLHYTVLDEVRKIIAVVEGKETT